MAKADYYLCDAPGCDNKVFYDVPIDYQDAYLNAEMAAICTQCEEKYRVVVVERKPKVDGSE